jgi:hypothetical protein
LERERTQAKPVLEALQGLGAAYKFQVEHAAELVATNQTAVQLEHKALRDRFKKLGEDRTNLLSEQSTKQQEKNALDQHFALRETHRDRLRNEGLLETKEVAVDALKLHAAALDAADALILRWEALHDDAGVVGIRIALGQVHELFHDKQLVIGDEEDFIS